MVAAALIVAPLLLLVGLVASREGLLADHVGELPWRRGALDRMGPRYPIVLVHGMVGEVEVGTSRAGYFRGVADRLRTAGIEVHAPRVSPAAPVSVRARELVLQIDKITARRVNIIAHSMGGLDARYAIAHLGLADRVASLTTIATPHHGTPLADVGTSFLGRKLGLRKLLSATRLNLDGVYDLTTSSASAFNRRVKNAPGVRYACVLAGTDGMNTAVNPLLRPVHRFLSSRLGPNDGLVPMSSQVWGEIIDEIDADHWAQIGWSTRFDAPAFYERLVHTLRTRGL